jgi:hypothetical protein
MKCFCRLTKTSGMEYSPLLNPVTKSSIFEEM